MRAARGLVAWTVRHLSERSGIHRNTITNIETGKSAGDPATLAATQEADVRGPAQGKDDARDAVFEEHEPAALAEFARELLGSEPFNSLNPHTMPGALFAQ